jgi:hypothetical protein
MDYDRVAFNKAVGLIILLALTFGGCFAILEARPWERSTELVGCVSAYEQVHHPNDHNVTDTYFSVDSIKFHLNDGFWVPGFKAGETFKLGDRVRVTRRSSHVTNVAVLSDNCQG